jgi:hypothetical protein
MAQTLTSLYQSEYRKMFNFDLETQKPLNMVRQKLKVMDCVERSLFFHSYGKYMYVTV